MKEAKIKYTGPIPKPGNYKVRVDSVIRGLDSIIVDMALDGFSWTPLKGELEDYGPTECDCDTELNWDHEHSLIGPIDRRNQERQEDHRLDGVWIRIRDIMQQLEALKIEVRALNEFSTKMMSRRVRRSVPKKKR